MENNKIFNNKNFGSVNMYEEKLLIIDKTLYDEIYNILNRINNILKLQKFSYEKYLKNSNNSLINLKEITPELLKDKGELIKNVVILYSNINDEFENKFNIIADNIKLMKNRCKSITNISLKNKFINKINEKYKILEYNIEYHDKLNNIYSEINKKDEDVKKLNKECASKFWTSYFLYKNNIHVKSKKNKKKVINIKKKRQNTKKEGENTKKEGENTKINNSSNNNNTNNNTNNNNLINTSNNRTINNKNIITNNILDFFEKDYLINIKNKIINIEEFPKEFTNILSGTNYENIFKNSKIIVNGRTTGLYIEIQQKNRKNGKYTVYGHMSFHFLEDWSDSPIHLKANSNKSISNIGKPLIDCFLKKSNYGIIIINREKYRSNPVIIFIIDVCILSLNQLYNEYQHTL